MRLKKQVLVTLPRQDHMTNYKHYICSTRVLTAIKLGMMAIYLDGLQPIKLHDLLITWS